MRDLVVVPVVEPVLEVLNVKVILSACHDDIPNLCGRQVKLVRWLEDLVNDSIFMELNLIVGLLC